jgi:hypothetical protein
VLPRVHDGQVLALGQGLYYFSSGAWPLLSMRSFEAVTGPKTDRWLVRTVGTLITVMGAVLVSAGARGRVSPEIAGLAVGSAAGLAAIDVGYALAGRISKVYLLDAALELGLVGGWLARTVRRRRGRR